VPINILYLNFAHIHRFSCKRIK